MLPRKRHRHLLRPVPIEVAGGLGEEAAMSSVLGNRDGDGRVGLDGRLLKLICRDKRVVFGADDQRRDIDMLDHT